MTTNRTQSVGLALIAGLLLGGCTQDEPRSEPSPITITMLDNVDRGGKNSAKAEWLQDFVIPSFEAEMSARSTPVEVELTESGIDDEDYKAGVKLELDAGSAPDVIGFDQFWLAEFVDAGLLEPLTDVVGPEVASWEGWTQIPGAIQNSMEFNGLRYGIPLGTDGRVLFYNKRLFRRAGMDELWEPRSWTDIVSTAQKLQRRLPSVTPLQLNAGVAMGEATTLQGFMPILLGTGRGIYDEPSGLWLGDTAQLRAALGFFDDVYSGGLADRELQTDPEGRDRSFELFSTGKIAILAESDYLWRSVLNPDGDYFPMPTRDRDIGWARIPAMEPGAGIRGQDFVSASGGSAAILNPASTHPAEAWEFMTYMHSRESLTDYLSREPRLSAREDVNRGVVDNDPLLTFIAREVLPITWFRPGFPEYADVSRSIARMVEDVATGRSSVEDAATTFETELKRVVGDESVESEG